MGSPRGEKYALRDLDDRVDGEGLTWWLYLPQARAPHVGGEALEDATKRGWWRVPSHVAFDPASSLVDEVSSGGRYVERYRRNVVLPDSEGLPEVLEPDEFFGRIDEDDETYDRRVRALYDPEYAEKPIERTPINGPWLVLDGAPPPLDGKVWEAKLPHELRHSPEYLHLFPGQFSGFRAALSKALEEIPGVSVYGASSSRVLSVSVRLNVPKLAPPERWAARPNLEGRSARARKRALEAHNSSIQQVTRQLEIPASDYVGGANRAEASALWDEAIAEIVGYVRDVVAERCPTCGGRGFVDPHHNDQED